MDKKNSLKVYKTIVWILILIAIVATWVILCGTFYEYLTYASYVSAGFMSFFLCLLGYSLTQRNLQIYRTDKGNEVVVFAGLYDHYIEVNGERVDEYKSAFYFTPIKMSYNINENEKIDVIISLTNKISVKINGKLVFPVK